MLICFICQSSICSLAKNISFFRFRFFFEVAGDSFVIHPKSEKLDREWKLFVYAYNKKKKKTIWKLNKFETEIPTCVIVMAVPFRRSYNFVFFSLCFSSHLFNDMKFIPLFSFLFKSLENVSWQKLRERTMWPRKKLEWDTFKRWQK